MALTLCSNCRLPVNTSAHRCHLCAAPLEAGAQTVQASVAAAVALAATVAVLVLRRA